MSGRKWNRSNHAKPSRAIANQSKKNRNALPCIQNVLEIKKKLEKHQKSAQMATADANKKLGIALAILLSGLRTRGAQDDEAHDGPPAIRSVRAGPGRAWPLYEGARETGASFWK